MAKRVGEEEEEQEEEEEKEEEEEQTALIKSSNPHLAGGEKNPLQAGPLLNKLPAPVQSDVARGTLPNGI